MAATINNAQTLAALLWLRRNGARARTQDMVAAVGQQAVDDAISAGLASVDGQHIALTALAQTIVG